MDSGPEDLELNGDLRQGSPGSPDASADGPQPCPFPGRRWSSQGAGVARGLPRPRLTTPPPPQPPRRGRNQPINVNHYANKKSAAESMLDIALLMANASQLKAVVEQGPDFAFFVPLVVLISISLVLQISVGVLLIFLVRHDLNDPAKHAKLDFLNNLATGLVFIIVVTNIFITAFGVQKPVVDVAPQQ
ncbi:hypothetical protein HPG69_007910 [Diceros bicornis minor]|uniref:Ninjurin 1 n=1 Tax=Diceros bicornis minor TaxID=77932 RepID=A0A7J7EB41_DICBM|nr:hypothetical protein HPG69_007910 [Diceros bicornis minor]